MHATRFQYSGGPVSGPLGAVVREAGGSLDGPSMPLPSMVRQNLFVKTYSLKY